LYLSPWYGKKNNTNPTTIDMIVAAPSGILQPPKDNMISHVYSSEGCH
jgi:hypothetical protein